MSDLGQQRQALKKKRKITLVTHANVELYILLGDKNYFRRIVCIEVLKMLHSVFAAIVRAFYLRGCPSGTKLQLETIFN